MQADKAPLVEEVDEELVDKASGQGEIKCYGFGCRVFGVGLLLFYW